MDPNQVNQRLRISKKSAIIALVALLSLFVMYWVLSFSYLSIHVDSIGAGEITYSIKSGEKQSVHASDENYKKLVRRGSYDITVSQGDKSSVSIVETSGFFKTKRVDINIENEYGRVFIGDNPHDCSEYIGGVLYSWKCEGEYKTLSRHNPATSSISTFTSSMTEAGGDSTIESLKNTPLGTILLLWLPPGHEEEHGGVSHLIYKMDEQLRIVDSIPLPQLDADKKYRIEPYGDGFLLFGEEEQGMYYYSSLDKKPLLVENFLATQESYKQNSLQTHNDNVAISFTRQERKDSRSGLSPSEQPSEVVVGKIGEEPRRYNFDKTYDSVLICEDGYLCALLDGELNVFDITEKSAILHYSLHGINLIQKVNNKMLFVRSGVVFGFDVVTKIGTANFALKSNVLCGIHSYTSNYGICIQDGQGGKSMLLIDSSLPDRDIDKKIIELRKSPVIKKVSVYREFVHISPNLGELEYNEALSSFVYNNQHRVTVNDQIDQITKQIGFDGYTIVNPYAY